MRVISVVGARPQFVKLAAVAKGMKDTAIEHVIVDTGQHYDSNLSAVFFDDLQIPKPDVNLGIGSGSHGVQTGAMLAALDEVFTKYSPDCVIVYGDTNSTLAAAVSAVKLHFPVAHLEAGLRSFNRAMPEEHNRVLTDHAADLLLPRRQQLLRLAQQARQAPKHSTHRRLQAPFSAIHMCNKPDESDLGTDPKPLWLREAELTVHFLVSQGS